MERTKEREKCTGGEDGVGRLVQQRCGTDSIRSSTKDTRNETKEGPNKGGLGLKGGSIQPNGL